MDIEQLKLILETLGAAGEGTKQLVLIYFAYLFAKAACIGALFGSLIFIVYRVALRIVHAATFEGRIRDVFGISCYLTSEESARIIEWAKRGRDMK